MARGLTPQGWYESPIAGKVHYQSGYERKFMVWLDQKGIVWQKCKERFPYVDSTGKPHNYNPDFYLPEWDLYVEVKGMIRMNDPLKFQAFPEQKKLLLLEVEELKQLGLSVFDPQGRRAPGSGWPNRILDQITDYSEVGELSSALRKRLKEHWHLLQPYCVA